MKEMEQYMTKKEIQIAFRDLAAVSKNEPESQEFQQSLEIAMNDAISMQKRNRRSVPEFKPPLPHV